MHVVRLIRGLAAALILVSAIMPSDLPAPLRPKATVKAPGTPEGVYTVNIDGQGSTTWEIYSICVPTVGDLREPLLLPVARKLNAVPAVNDLSPGWVTALDLPLIGGAGTIR